MHTPVLLHETIRALAITKSGVYCDGTLGGGGHAEEIAKQLDAKGIFIGADLDKDAIIRSKKRLAPYPCKKIFIHDSFDAITKPLLEKNITVVDGITFDLGLSMYQLKDPVRGFSFLHEGPLEMMIGTEKGEETITAYDIIHTFKESVLADLIYVYGDERYAKRIAKQIVATRIKKPIQTTTELAKIITRAYPSHARRGKTHPATKTFQALRIVVNDEYGRLTRGIEYGFQLLRPGGRLAIITFHSGEDRIVKDLFKSFFTEEKGILITKKPIVPTKQEIQKNPSSRSAKLRVIEKQKIS